MAHHRLRLFFYFLAFAILFLSSSFTSAVDIYWNATSGDWSTASNWGGAKPTSEEYAYIQNGGTASITQTDENCRVLYLGNTGNSGTIQMTGGSLSVFFDESIGNSGMGTFTQTGGTNIIPFSLDLGNSTGSSGTYNLSGTGHLYAGDEHIGYHGTGMFNQTGGTNAINNLYLGDYPGSIGTYNLSGMGQLSAGSEYIGSSGIGKFRADRRNEHRHLFPNRLLGWNIYSYCRYIEYQWRLQQ